MPRTISYIKNVFAYLAKKDVVYAVDKSDLEEALELLVTKDKRKANEYIVFMLKHKILVRVSETVFDIHKENLP